jgi:hypothetical protein
MFPMISKGRLDGDMRFKSDEKVDADMISKRNAIEFAGSWRRWRVTGKPRYKNGYRTFCVPVFFSKFVRIQSNQFYPYCCK